MSGDRANKSLFRMILLHHSEESIDLKDMNETVAKLGFWSGLLTIIFSIAYSIPQILLASLPLSALTTTDLFFIMFPSLLLPWSFIVLMVAIHYYAPQEKKIWSHIGIVWAVLYAAFVSIVYFTVLTVVVPAMSSGTTSNVSLLLYLPSSFMTALDALGYFSLSMATLFAGQVFLGGKIERWTRRMFLFNGVLAPIFLLVQVVPQSTSTTNPLVLFVDLGALWLISFNASAILATLVFHRQRLGTVERRPSENL